MAKRKLLTVVVLASIFALVSCDDSTSSTNAVDPTTTSSGSTIGALDPNSSAGTSDPTVAENPTDNGQLVIPAASSADNGQQAIPAASSADNITINPESSADNGQQVNPVASSADNITINPESSADNGQKVNPAASSADNGQKANSAASSADNGQKANSAASSADNGQKTNPVASSSSNRWTNLSGSSFGNPSEKSSSSSAPAVSSSSEAPAKTGIFLAEGTEEEKRQLDIEYQEGKGPDGQSVLAYPKKLSSTQKHGVVVWGPGGGEKPGNYPDMIKDLASHGFVVIGIRESPGNGSLAIQAIDWLEKENNNSGSVFYGKLDMTKVGCSGHSMGGLESEQAAIKDKRVITAFLNNSGDQGSGAFANIPSDKTAGVVFGEKGSERSNAIRDYQSSRQTPACMIEMTGGPMNSEGGWGHGSGPWDGRAITIAWMRWQLGGEDFRKADFVGTSGKYINGRIINHQGNWKGECKNFK